MKQNNLDLNLLTMSYSDVKEIENLLLFIHDKNGFRRKVMIQSRQLFIFPLTKLFSLTRCVSLWIQPWPCAPVSLLWSDLKPKAWLWTTTSLPCTKFQALLFVLGATNHPVWKSKNCCKVLLVLYVSSFILLKTWLKKWKMM